MGREAQAPAKMLREADAAMYRAKERGRGRAEMFDEAMRRDAFERLRTESDLRRALERDEFRVLYQPIFDTATLRPIAVEALVRWQHPTRGVVGPVEFIPLAEETGLIAPLGRWVLEHAVAEVAGWAERFPDVPLRVAVNVSGQQLARPEFLHEVRAALEASDLPPERLGLEITESILIKESGSPRSTLEALREIGVKVLIDDFGTGYSSLARLKRFPLDVIKIDRSFVAGVGAEDEDTAIVAAIVEIARSLGLQVVAEGVEGEVQLERLRELGCHAVQGYLFSGPLHGDAFAAFLADEEPDTAGRRRGPVTTPPLSRRRGAADTIARVAEHADIRVRLTPRAARRADRAPAADGAYAVRVTAPPVDGRANDALCRLIAARAGVAPSRGQRRARSQGARQGRARRRGRSAGACAARLLA